MSAYRTDYIVYGWKLPYDIKNSSGENIDLWDDKFLPLIEGHEGEKLTLIRDSVYFVFGLAFKSCSSDEGWGCEILDSCFDDADARGLMAQFKDLFKCEPEGNPSLLIFSHWS